jgi:hypothetical protein
MAAIAERAPPRLCPVVTIDGPGYFFKISPTLSFTDLETLK